MVGRGMAGDAAVMAAVEGCRQAQMRGAGLLPEARLLRPIGRRPRSHRDPHLDARLLRYLCSDASRAFVCGLIQGDVGIVAMPAPAAM